MPLDSAQIETLFGRKEADVKRLIPTIVSLNIQQEVSENFIIGTINKLLSNAKSRQDGLEYLLLVANNCSLSVLEQNANNWIGHCIVKFPDDNLRELKLKVIGETVQVAHKVQDFNKKFLSEHISKVVDNCVSTAHKVVHECRAALKTLSIIMKYFPNWFGAHREKIGQFITSHLDSANDELVQAAALAFHYFQQVGPSGTKGANYKTNFTDNFHKLCRTAQAMFDKFFENQNEIFEMETNEGDLFQYPDCPTEALAHVYARRIRNIFKFIETMIKTGYPAEKRTEPYTLLKVLQRPLSIHKCITSDAVVSMENCEFSLLLVEIQCAALRLLRLYIIWYQTDLPFSYVISKLIIDSIQKGQLCDCFKADGLYQESSYRCMIQWLSITKSSLSSKFQSRLLECILKDITPVKPQITLTISEDSVKKRSQKAKRKAMLTRIVSSGNELLGQEFLIQFEQVSEQKTCRFALTSLCRLLEATKLTVKADLLKRLYKSLLQPLLNFQSSKPIHPYTDAGCRVKLYEALVAVFHQNALSFLPFLNASLNVLSSGVNDKDWRIARACEIGMKMLELACQPVCSSLHVQITGDSSGEERTNRQRSSRPESNNDDSNVSTAGSLDNSTQMLSEDGAGSAAYQVKYTDTDRSTIEDESSVKGIGKLEEVTVVELESDSVTNEGPTDNIEIEPIVTAPSEDGNEVLSDEKVETVQERNPQAGGDSSVAPDGNLVEDEVEAAIEAEAEAAAVETKAEAEAAATKAKVEDWLDKKKDQGGEPPYKKPKLSERPEEDSDDSVSDDGNFNASAIIDDSRE